VSARRAAVAGLLLLLSAAAVSAALSVPPPPDRRVNDYAGALSPAERDRLEQKLIERERGSANQIVVAVFRSLEGASLEDFSIRLAQSWRIGRKGLDNGVIFLIFLDDRKTRIEVGYGLEANLTDAISSSILRDVVSPRFREGRLADGMAAGLDAIDQAIAGTYRQPAPARPPGPQGIDLFTLILILFVLGGAVLPVMLSSARVRRNGWTGGSAGWGGPFIGGGGFSGGGGGFSGGGGGFGGGGASGSW